MYGSERRGGTPSGVERPSRPPASTAPSSATDCPEQVPIRSGRRDRKVAICDRAAQRCPDDEALAARLLAFSVRIGGATAVWTDTCSRNLRVSDRLQRPRVAGTRSRRAGPRAEPAIATGGRRLCECRDCRIARPTRSAGWCPGFRRARYVHVRRSRHIADGLPRRVVRMTLTPARITAKNLTQSHNAALQRLGADYVDVWPSRPSR